MYHEVQKTVKIGILRSSVITNENQDNPKIEINGNFIFLLSDCLRMSYGVCKLCVRGF